MEERIAHLESDVGHMRSDIADIKVDLRSVRDQLGEMNGVLSRKSEARVRFSGKSRPLDALERLQEEFASTMRWALLLYIAFAGGMFGALARGFGWI